MLLEMVAARETARPMPDDRMTVGKWLGLWLRSPSVTKLRYTTIQTYTYAVRLLLPELGGIPLRKLRSTNVEAALQRLPDRAATNARAVLSTAIKDAMRAGHVLTNEAALARGPKVGRHKLPAPDSATVRTILGALESHRLHSLYVTLAGTGLRIGEATGLRWTDIDDDRLTVTFQVQRIDGELVHTDPKTDTAGRIVFLPPAVQAALRAQKARQAAERLAAGTKWRRTDERGDGEQLVFTTAEGQPVSEQTAWWVLNKACRDAGTRHVGLHDLRRFYLSEVQDKVGMAAARLVAGHTDEKMTAGYVSVRDGLLARAAEAAQEAIGG